VNKVLILYIGNTKNVKKQIPSTNALL